MYKILLHHTVTALLLISLVSAQSVLAQEVIAQPGIEQATTSSAGAAPAVDVIPESPGQAVSPASPEDPSPLLLQDTSLSQEAVTAAVLESTVNPETTLASPVDEVAVIDAATTGATSTNADTATIPVVGTDASSTPEDASPIEPVPALDVVNDVLIEAPSVEPIPATDIALSPTPERSIAISQKDLTPAPDFAFAITGKRVPTKKMIRDADGDVVRIDSVANTLVPEVDNTKGQISFTGSCNDAYYVVLLFAHQNDYYDDPSSYILNKAYPCVGGQYAYAITDLPVNLRDGTYYLLVGSEGEKGAWEPITSLTEITINRKGIQP